MKVAGGISAAKLLLLAASGLSVAGCGEGSVQVDKQEQQTVETVETVTTSSTEAASSSSVTAELSEEAGGVRVRVAASGLTPGVHGMHVHEIGRCDGPKFTSAGAHWNPAGKQHGRENPAGAHLGDLANLEVGPDGRGSGNFLIADAKLEGGAQPMYDADGAVLLIHAKADDYRTDPGGDSGDRIECALLAPPR